MKPHEKGEFEYYLHKELEEQDGLKGMRKVEARNYQVTGVGLGNNWLISKYLSEILMEAAETDGTEQTDLFRTASLNGALKMMVLLTWKEASDLEGNGASTKIKGRRYPIAIELFKYYSLGAAKDQNQWSLIDKKAKAVRGGEVKGA